MSIHFKKSKEDVLAEVHARCYGNIQYHLQNDLNNLLKLENNYNGSPSISLNSTQMSIAIAHAISRAVQEGFRVVLENQYTDEDLERDLTLSP